MRIAREQTVCVISPAMATTESKLHTVEHELCTALLASGIVHFATFAMLPRPQGTSADVPALLLFEIAVDEGLRPVDMFAALVQAAFRPLWEIYGHAWIDGNADKIVWLREHLQRHASVADGAFIGARDRGLAQIVLEQELLQATVAASHCVAPAVRARARTFCAALAGSVLSQSEFGWAQDSVPRSFWRSRAAGTGAKLKLLFTVVLVAAGAAWLAHQASSWAAAHLPEPLVWPFAAAALVSGHFLDDGWWLLRAAGAIVLVLVGVAILRFLLPPFRRLLDGIHGELNRAEAKPLATVYEGLVAGAALVVMAIFFGALVLHLEHAYGTPWGPLATLVRGAFAVARDQLWLIGASGSAMLLALMVVSPWPNSRPSVLFATARRGYEKLGLWQPYEVKRAQHIDAAVETCEARLAARGSVAHMISLVDIRRPVPWFRFWLRLWLRVITIFGRIVYTEGKLGDAPGIHFGHWHIVDEGRRLLFCSNFDGKWGGYLDDFINGASMGLNAIWCCTTLRLRSGIGGVPTVLWTRAFPPTRLALWRGVKCEQWFKAYARDSMLPHVVRFEAYKHSLADIERATALREALMGGRNVVNDDRIMRILES